MTLRRATGPPRLWWFDDSARDLSEKVRAAAARYWRKFGSAPDVCFVHPSVLGDELTVGGVAVRPDARVLRHHFSIGREEQENDRLHTPTE